MGRFKHGHAIRSKNDLEKRTYQIWKGINRRCHGTGRGKTHQQYRDRGVIVCTEWRRDYLAFLRDMGTVPSLDHSIDRKDNTLGYSPTNCRWTTVKTQTRNRRGWPSHSSRFKGVTRRRGGFIARITVNYVTMNLGTFGSEEDAAVAYNDAAKKHFGQDAHLNRLRGTK